MCVDVWRDQSGAKDSKYQVTLTLAADHRAIHFHVEAACLRLREADLIRRVRWAFNQRGGFGRGVLPTHFGIGRFAVGGLVVDGRRFRRRHKVAYY